MNSRQRIQAALTGRVPGRIVGVLLPLLTAACLADEQPPRPDILLIMPDQMRGDCLSAVGHPAVLTPHLDGLAQQGALFRRAYSTVPSCIPARYALLTGLAPQTSGEVGYAYKPFTTVPLPEFLAEAGYATVLVGRNMHQSPTSELGYQKQILGSTYVTDDEYDKFLKQNAPETDGIKNFVERQLKLSNNKALAAPWPLAENLHPTAWVVGESRKIVGEEDPDRPLFLTASFYAPHPPLFPPKRFFDACLKSKLPSPAHGNWVDWQTLSTKGNRVGDRILLSDDALQNVQAGYFGLIEQLDSEIEKLVVDFKARSTKAGRPWLIVVTSDHGEMLGDHGYFRKCEPYEGAANIPFIIAGSPELGFKPGLRCNQPVCLEDIMPTLLGLAGVPRPAGIDGVDLVPTLRGDSVTIRDCLHSEHAPCYGKEQAFQALTDGRFKYIWRPTDGSEQLFDLQNDPKEERNLAKDPASLAMLEQWRARLIQRLAPRPEGFSDGHRLIPGRPYKAVNTGNEAE